MRSSILFAVVVAFGLVASACPGLLGSDRISEGQAAKIQERNDEVAESLPVFDNREQVRESHLKCEGAFLHEAYVACLLNLRYETSRPLADVLAFYESYFASEGWNQLEVDSLQSRYFKANGIYLSIAISLPPLTCPDPYTKPDAATACKEKWIANEGGEFTVSIGPD